MEEQLHKVIQKKWKNWPYKNTAFLLISLFLFIYFAETPFISNLIKRAGDLGYLGSFITGIFFVSSFTVAPAIAILYKSADILNPILLAVCAGLGAVLGDYLIFRFLKDKIFEELAPIFTKIGGSFIKKLFLTPFFIWLIPIMGAFIIASPFPDEVGIGMMGLSKIKRWHFVLIAFLLNSFGIFIVITLARSI